MARVRNTQRGRYREFMQCDFDTIGTKAIAADIETGLVIQDLMCAVGFAISRSALNNRMVLTGLLEQLDLADAVPMLRVLDKLPKSGRREAERWMVTAQASKSSRPDMLPCSALSEATMRCSASRPSIGLKQRNRPGGRAKTPRSARGVAAAGRACAQLKIDVSIARGLDYYTGTVFETYLDALPAIGSVCSGGRYDNLAELYTSQELPGIGASLGLDRLLAAMEELGMIEKVSTTAPVFIPYLRCRTPRTTTCNWPPPCARAGIGVEVYPEPKKLGQQLKYADRRGFRVALIAGGNEFAAGRSKSKTCNRHPARRAPGRRRRQRDHALRAILQMDK